MAAPQQQRGTVTRSRHHSRPRRCLLLADCAPGFFAADGATCSPCQVGRYCPGGVLANNAASTCPEGLATIIIGAKSAAQCMTTPGWGRAFVRDPRGDVTISSTRCGVGTYNMGRNANGCQRCAPGLTTRDQGATAPSDCGEQRRTWWPRAHPARIPAHPATHAASLAPPALSQSRARARTCATAPAACARAAPTRPSSTATPSACPAALG